MAISLKHNFQSAVADEGDTSLVRPSNWNAEHDLTLATSRLVGRTTAGTGSAEEISVGTGLSLNAGSLAVSSTTPQVNSTNTFTVAQVISATDNSNPALRITQLGTADALRVEDETSPDATPFVITANGHAIAGYGSALTIETVVPQFQSHTDVLAEGGFGGVDWGNTATGQVNWFGKSRGGSYGAQGILSSGDTIGDFRFYGSDGVNLIPAAKIEVDIDGTPGVNDMPGRISFFTTADGASTVTERMRINNAGNVGIGTSSPVAIGGHTGILTLFGSNATALALRDSAGGKDIRLNDGVLSVTTTGGTPELAIDASGNVGIGAAFSSNAPQSLLHLMSTAGGGDIPRLRFSNGSTGHTATDGSFVGISNTSQLDLWNFENNAIRLATNNSERMRIDGTGNVGIGTTSPGVRLDVSNSSAAVARFTGPNNGYVDVTDGTTTLRSQIIASVPHIGSPTSTALNLTTNNTTRFTIGALGQWGIGGATYGTSGQAYLSGGASAAPSWGDVARPGVSNTFTANQIISVTDNTNAALRITQLGTGNAITVEDSTNPDSTPFVVDANGNVGVGTSISAWSGLGGGSALQTHSAALLSTPSGGSNTTTLATNAFYNGSSWTYRVTSTATRYDQWSNEHRFFNAPSGTAGASISFAERLRIGPDGQLGIGGANYGTSTQYMKSGGSGAAPTWATIANTDISGLGTMSTQNASSVSITGGSITGITDLAVADGGTGASSFTAYSVVVGGTTSTGPLQNVVGVGTSGQVLTSNGAGTLPSWQTSSAATASDVVTLALILG